MNVLITGSSSGFGRLTTETLARKGHTVFASMRGVHGKNEAAAAELRALGQKESLAIEIVELDVASDASVDAGVKQVLAKAGHLDVVVNNAGVSGFGHEEGYTPEQMRTLFEINVFGVQRVNRAVLPSMRARGQGLVVFISSSLGRIVLPCMGVYTASKWAIEALAESYRYELAATGVDVAIVQPGAFATNLVQNSIFPAEGDRAAGYGAAAQIPQQMGAMMESMLKGPNAPSPQLVADAVLGLVSAPAGQRPLRVLVDPLTGQGTEAINAVAAQVQAGLLNMMGMGSAVPGAAR